jgi:hypothetical protein
MVNSAARPGQQHKSVWIAMALQCVPLLSLAAAALAGWELLWGALLFWGLGYKYLGKTWRWAAVGLLGPVFVLLSGAIAILAGGFDHPNGSVHADMTAAVLVNIGAVVVLAVDAWRLAMLHNDALDTAERQGQELPAQGIAKTSRPGGGGGA